MLNIPVLKQNSWVWWVLSQVLKKSSVLLLLSCQHALSSLIWTCLSVWFTLCSYLSYYAEYRLCWIVSFVSESLVNVKLCLLCHGNLMDEQYNLQYKLISVEMIQVSIPNKWSMEISCFQYKCNSICTSVVVTSKYKRFFRLSSLNNGFCLLQSSEIRFFHNIKQKP